MVLNEFGKKVWKHKTNKRLFLEQAYSWKQSLILLDETKGRKIINCFDSESEVDFRDWEPMSKCEYDSVQYKYCEIYRREENLDILL